MNFDYTPGPWYGPHFATDRTKCKCGYIFSEFQNGMGAIARVYFATDEDPENEPFNKACGNASLIAAAPTMFEFIINSKDFLPDSLYNEATKLLNDIENGFGNVV